MVNVDVETLSGTDHPVCAFIKRLRSIFLMAQPPLLSEEGNTLPCNSFTPSQTADPQVNTRNGYDPILCPLWLRLFRDFFFGGRLVLDEFLELLHAGQLTEVF